MFFQILFRFHNPSRKPTCLFLSLEIEGEREMEKKKMMTSPKSSSPPPPSSSSFSSSSLPSSMLRRVCRGAKTLFFLTSMLGSFLFFCSPLLVVVLDVLLPSALLSAFVSPLSLQTISAHLWSFDFRATLVDVPLLSIARSLVIICVYSLCDGPGLSRGPYLGMTMFCSLASVAYVSVKACVFGDLVRRQRAVAAFEQKEVLALQALFLSSVVLAVAHMVAAYRTSCRERRKLLVYRIDLEAVSACKNGFPGYHKLIK